jgi:hypothetical protein
VLVPQLLRGFDLSGIDEFSMSVLVYPETGAVVALEMRFFGSVGLLQAAADFVIPADALLLLVIGLEVSQLNDSAIAIEPPI